LKDINPDALPSAERPETTTDLASRLVTSHLNIRRKVKDSSDSKPTKKIPRKPKVEEVQDAW